MKIVLPLPPTLNHLFATDFKSGRRFKSKEYKEWIDKAEAAIIENNRKWKCEGTEEVRLELYMYSNWYTLKKKIRKKDLSNRIKAIEDKLCDIIEGFDDKQIFELFAKKVHSDREEIELRIIEL